MSKKVLEVNWDSNPYNGLTKILNDELEHRETFNFADGIVLGRRETKRNLWVIIVDKDAVTTFDADMLFSTRQLGAWVDRVAAGVRDEDEEVPSAPERDRRGNAFY